MKIQAINNQTFGVSRQYDICREYPNTFYTLSEDDKLDVVYDMLREQKLDLVTLSINQYKMQNFNKNVSSLLPQLSRDTHKNLTRECSVDVIG